MAAKVTKAPPEIGNRLMMVMFASLGVVNLIGGDYLGGSIWVGLATALAIMGPEGRPWRAIPPWRRLLGSALVVISLGLFGYQAFLDFSG